MVSEPTIYNIANVYGNNNNNIIVIPSDIKLFEELTNISDLSNNNVDDIFRIYFAEKNDNIYFGFLGQVNLSYLEEAVPMRGETASKPVFWMRIHQNYSTQAAVQYCNGSTSSTSQPLSLTYLNQRICFEIQNGKIIDRFANTVLKNNNNVFASKDIGYMRLPYNTNSKLTAGYIQISRYYMKDDKGNYLHNLYPAKRGGVPGLFDIVTGTFYNAVNYTKWECYREVIL